MRHFSELSPAALRVVDAAEGLLQRQGYNGFSYDDVSALIGIKKPSIHYHFPKKEDLVAMVAQRYRHRFREQLLGIEGTCADPLERLQAYAVLFEQTFSQRRLCLGAMLGAEYESLPPSVLAELDAFFKVNVEWLTLMVTQGQQAGRIRNLGAPASLAQTLICTLEGAMIVGRAMNSAEGPAQIGATLLNFLQA
ncbi:TetR/AcrR family transcriptional regulator [Pseudomonas muyukensis]|uniref:TetR/AcrR family transcriptional regulator n=1 Tax=Pseudomonas muyukensis TaxID=2842357 RepID=A0ABX8MA70_9PSED|nr:TetR/AcrR family transcriptional regulator [Pseudomonas muyukensis]QXH35432.1 TetR/AcrR family transcriptional regulator [Pseudomonas muyukensis]